MTLNKRLLTKLCVVCVGLTQSFNVLATQNMVLNTGGSTATKVQQEESFSPQVNQPELKADFSNVINFKQFKGFTKKQLEMLRQNGFVVMAQNSKYPDLKMHQLYEEAEYSQTPMFISTDAVLNLYHIFYSDSLKALETSKLQGAMTELSTTMLRQSLNLYNDVQYSQEREQLKTIVTYYAVACLLAGEEVNVPSEIKEIADQEVALINKAEGTATSPLLGKTMDYTQYTVRGHYATTTALGKYFKTMMWYGQIGFELTTDTGEINLDNAKLATMMSMMVLNNPKAYELWDKVYTATTAYVGVADDITLINLEKLIKDVYGEHATLKMMGETQYDEALKAAIKTLPEPKIVAKISVTPNTVKGKQFRMMGQRYTIDADVMQQLIKPIDRPESSGLDVIAALGSSRAEVLANKYENPENWSEYSSKLKAAMFQCKSITDDTWNSNMYNGWLWTIQSAMKSFENTKGMPNFMRTKAWTDKSIVTALGSYAELKHDTVLYNKQACAERGGPDGNMPYIYVEPNVEFYTKLLSLIYNTKHSLQSVGTLDSETSEILDDMQRYIETMRTCSIKELTNKNFTEDEYWTLMAFGGMVDRVSNTLLNMNLKYDGETNATYTSALITDVSTILDTTECVEIGTGIPYSIYVICPYKGKLFLAEGAVFSYYEFTSSERLTDEKWHQMIGIEKETNYGYEYVSVNPAATAYKQYAPKWQSTYFSSEPNNVTKQGVEIIWDQSMRPDNPQPGADGEYDYER